MIQQGKMIFFFFLVIVIFGASGFYSLENNLSIFDSIYMTVLTLSTFGYGEVQPMSQGGKIWAMIVILFGVTGFAMVLSSLNTSIINFKE